MTVQTQIEIQLRCNVCDSVLTVESSPRHDKHGWWLYVEPCEKCGLTQRAPDVAYCTCKNPIPAHKNSVLICAGCMKPQRW